MAASDRAGRPWHLWVVGILSLFWNAIGAIDYTMTATGNAAYLEYLGFGPEEMAWIDAFPVWATAVWAIGVWGSVAGSMLLLLRSRHAAAAFLISAAGAGASLAYQMTSDKPPSLDGAVALVMPVFVLILIVLQWRYSRRMALAGVLR